MKKAFKLLSVLLAVMMVLALAAGCVKPKDPETTPTGEPEGSPEVTESVTDEPAGDDATEEPTEEPADDPTEEPTEEPTPEHTSEVFVNPDLTNGYEFPADGSKTELDLDCDGLADTFWTTHEYDAESEETCTKWHVVLGADPANTREGSVYGALSRCVAVDCDPADSRIEIIMEFLDLEAEEQGFTGALRVADAGNEVKYFETEGALEKQDSGYFEEGKLRINAFYDFFGEYEGAADHVVTNDGFERVSYIEFKSGGPSHTTIQSIPGFKVASEGVPGEAMTIPSGIRVYPQYSDASTFVVVMVTGGSLSYIKIGIDAERQIALINGQYYFKYLEADY